MLWGIGATCILAFGGYAVNLVKASSPDFRGARGLFILAGLFMLGLVVHWAAITSAPVQTRVIVVAASMAAVTATLILLLHWVRQKENGAMPKEPKDRKSRSVIGPGAVVSFNQSGGITAGNVNINTNFPPPKIELVEMAANEPEGELYRSTARMVVTTMIPVPELYLEARAPTIMRIEALPHNQTGVFTIGYTRLVAEGVAVRNIPNARGEYIVTFYSRKPEKFAVTYSY